MDWIRVSRGIVLERWNSFGSAWRVAVSAKHVTGGLRSVVMGQLPSSTECLRSGFVGYGVSNSKRIIRKIMSKDKLGDEVSRDELIENLERFQDDLKNTVSNKSTQLKALIGGASSLAMFSSFLLGRKSGKKRGSRSDSETAE